MQEGLLAIGQLDLQLGGEHQRDLVLHGEDVVDGAVVALGPEMGTAGGIDQLGGDADAVAALANAALEDMAHAELACRFADVDGAVVDELRLGIDGKFE